jgi:citrate lyase subunit beta / citryl-CoA lyase
MIEKEGRVMAIPRSYLFVPGTKQNLIKKAVSSDADCVILDLEDAVAISEKENARETVSEILLNYSLEKEMIVRINDLHTPYWEKDLICAIRGGAKGVMVPKSENGSEIKMLCRMAREVLAEAPRDFKVIPLIETAKGVQFAYSISSSDDMISRLAFGSIDFSLDIGCDLTPNGLELLFARSQIVIVSKAAGIDSPIDAVYPDLNNDSGLGMEAKFAKQLGFKAKLIIHPKQIQTVHKSFAPTETEVVIAKDIVQAFEAAEKSGVASIKVNNQLVDYPVYKKAKSIVALSNIK